MSESINKLISEIFSESIMRLRRANGYAHVHHGEHHECAQVHNERAHEDKRNAELPESADLLYAYIEAELDELNASLMFPEVHRDLADNFALQEAYGELRELLAMEREDRLIEPPVMPSFDFSYLKQQAAPAVLLQKSWNLDRVGRLVIEFTSELLQSIRPLDLQPALVKSGHGSNTDKMYHYVLKDQLKDLNVEIGVKPDPAVPGQCHVAAWVGIPSREGWPNWKNSRIEMRMGQQILQSQLTDAFGRVLFDPIDLADLPQLTFEVTPVTLIH
ncbi:MAG: hypothetical protein R2911_42625 [Caldilineaceae bacterium]